MPLTSLSFILLASLSSCIGNILLKASRIGLAPDAGLIGPLLTPCFLGSIAFFVLSFVVFGKALDRVPVSLAYPVLATAGFSLLAIASSWIFGERLSGLQGLGLVVAVFGIALLAVG